MDTGATIKRWFRARQVKAVVLLLLAAGLGVLAWVSARPSVVHHNDPSIDCGVTSLCDALSLLDIKSDAQDLSSKLHIRGKSGTTFADIQRVAEDAGVVVEGLRLRPDELINQRPPCIAFVRGNHFVTLAAMDRVGNRALVLDRPRSAQWVSVTALSKDWKGEILRLSRRSSISVPPRLWLPDERTELGEFRGTKREKTELTVINIGDAPLTVRDVRFSCQCADVEFRPSTIAPHGVATAVLHVDTTQKPEGRFNLTMLVRTDSAAMPVQPIKLSGLVRHPFRASPGFFALGDIQTGEQERVLTTHLLFGKGVSVSLKPVYLDDAIRWGTWQAVGDGEYAVQCVFDPKQVKRDADGRFRIVMVIGTDKPEYPSIRIGVVGRCLEAVSVAPKSLFLGQVQPGQQVTRRVRLSGVSSSDQVHLFAGQDIGQTTSAVASFEATMSNGGVIHYVYAPPWLTITVSAPSGAGVFSETVVVKVGAHEVPIDIAGVVKQ